MWAVFNELDAIGDYDADTNYRTLSDKLEKRDEEKEKKIESERKLEALFSTSHLLQLSPDCCSCTAFTQSCCLSAMCAMKWMKYSKTGRGII